MAKIVFVIIICILTFYMASDSKWVLQQIGLKPEVDKQRAAEKIAFDSKVLHFEYRQEHGAVVDSTRVIARNFELHG